MKFLPTHKHTGEIIGDKSDRITTNGACVKGELAQEVNSALLDFPSSLRVVFSLPQIPDYSLQISPNLHKRDLSPHLGLIIAHVQQQEKKLRYSSSSALLFFSVRSNCRAHLSQS